MPDPTISLFDLPENHIPASEGLALVRLSPDQVALIPFTDRMVPVELHWCDEPEIRGFVRCNGEGCALCRAGRSAATKLLLPVYDLARQAVAVLPVSDSRRPGALLPRLQAALQGADLRCVLLVRAADRYKHEVERVTLREGMDDGAAAVAAFLADVEAGRVDPAGAYARYDDADLAEVPGIATMLRLREGD